MFPLCNLCRYKSLWTIEGTIKCTVQNRSQHQNSHAYACWNYLKPHLQPKQTDRLWLETVLDEYFSCTSNCFSICSSFLWTVVLLPKYSTVRNSYMSLSAHSFTVSCMSDSQCALFQFIPWMKLIELTCLKVLAPRLKPWLFDCCLTMHRHT